MSFFIIILLLCCFHIGYADHSHDPQDTLTVPVISFDMPSPEGWGAKYTSFVQFPDDDHTWSKILMTQTLKCDSTTKADEYPCGEWDYIWDTFLKVPAGDSTEVFSLGSFVTPYGKRLELGGETGWVWTYDVTRYAPLLKGSREIKTGNNQELLDLKFHFIPGTPVRQVRSVKNIYPYGNYKYEYLASDSLLKERALVLDPDAAGFRLLARISGHGHHGPFNCCEWDSKTHTYYINKWEKLRWNVWKDCGHNPIFPQGGTWPFDRAGWCPGTKVDEYEFEITQLVQPGDTMLIDYAVEPFQDNGESSGDFRMSHQLFSFGPPNFQYDVELIDILKPTAVQAHSRQNPSFSAPIIKIRNSGSLPLQTLTIQYGLSNGVKSKTHWHGSLNFYEEELITLPVPDWTGLASDRRFEVHLSAPNQTTDQNPGNNKMSSSIPEPLVIESDFILHIFTNDVNRSKENTAIISDINGTVFFYYDTFLDSTSYNFQVSLPEGWYEFRFLDDMEDGISRHWWLRSSHPEWVGINGEIQFQTTDGELIRRFPADFGDELFLGFRVGRLP